MRLAHGSQSCAERTRLPVGDAEDGKRQHVLRPHDLGEVGDDDDLGVPGEAGEPATDLGGFAVTVASGVTLTLTAADIGGKPDVIYPEAREPMLELADGVYLF